MGKANTAYGVLRDVNSSITTSISVLEELIWCPAFNRTFTRASAVHSSRDSVKKIVDYAFNMASKLLPTE